MLSRQCISCMNKGPLLPPDLSTRNVTGWKEEVDPLLASGSSLTADRIAQHLAKSADKLLRSKVSHNKRESGWRVHHWRDPGIVSPSSKTRCCPRENVKESHLCEVRKMHRARRGNMAFFEFHFNTYKPCQCSQVVLDFPLSPPISAPLVMTRVRAVAWIAANSFWCAKRAAWLGLFVQCWRWG